MYADREEAAVTAKSSVRERLDRRSVGGFSSRSSVTGKRQGRDEDDMWEHDLFKDNETGVSNNKIGTGDLRSKLQRKSLKSTIQSGNGLSSRSLHDLRDKLSGAMHSQPLNKNMLKTKVSGPLKTKNKVADIAPETVSKKVARPPPKKNKGRCLALIQAASDVSEQGAVDDRDTFLHNIRDLLSLRSSAQVGMSTYVSAPGIIQQISDLRSNLHNLQSELENTLPEDRSRAISELCTLIQNLQQLLFASSTTAQPILTPRALMKELEEMEKINVKLSAALEEVTLEQIKKSEIVKHHSEAVKIQRRVFVDFFCNPDQLRKQVRELTARVRALQAS